MRTIELREFDPRSFGRRELPDELGERLWREYGNSPARIDVEFPSPKTNRRWLLRNLGWVGLLPLDTDTILSLQPKAPIANVFRMLEYAYRLDVFLGPEEVIGAGTMQEVYESIARVLARRVRDRGRKGLHRTYVARDELLSVIRGRLDTRKLVRNPIDPRFQCLYEEHTPDHEDNQILFDALDRVLRSGICRDQARREVRDAHRLLRGAVTPATFTERDAIGGSYDRLNHDYRGLHALARFFLAHAGPTHRSGEAGMTPFLINMARLFERFVAEWLKEQLPPGLSLEAKRPGSYDPEGDVRYEIDLVLYDDEHRPLAVLDTKYKMHEAPAPQDVAQVVSYALAVGCSDAVLVYPWARAGKEFLVGSVRVRAVGLGLGEADHRPAPNGLPGPIAMLLPDESYGDQTHHPDG